MRSQADIRRGVGAEDVVKKGLATDVLGVAGFGVGGVPEGVVLCETAFESVGGEAVGDEGLIAAAVAGVCVETFTQQFFDLGDERGAGGEVEAEECYVGRHETAGQRGDVVGLGRGDLLVGDQGGPEVVGGLGLLDAEGGEVSVGPGDGAVAV